ncbi:phosphotransferase family protein [Paenibacillus sp. MMS18-CY102]|uniref:phosphotransferase family protein n=1 Tax=Paenibacillus sp. MMS18-CY102 TaxID=2682849 RepID=UPI00136645D2|nr:aminoglycoside phosphotransferase family protein [Paenibacillus sp. MMS18-CY102]MWC29409.1 phosphotransferase [Paenibacillus sp. MMS18-CY102]
MASIEASEHAVPERAQLWVLKSFGQKAQWVSSRRLKGGVSAAVYGVTLRVGQDSVQAVLRLFDNAGWVREEPDLSRHEGAVLRSMTACANLPVPQLIAYDELGSEAGMPAVLMTYMRGEIDLMPHDQSLWLDELAAVLSRIHATDAKEVVWAFYLPRCFRMGSSCVVRVPE